MRQLYRKTALITILVFIIETAVASPAFAEELYDAPDEPYQAEETEDIAEGPEEDEPKADIEEPSPEKAGPKLTEGEGDTEDPGTDPDPEVKNGWIVEDGKTYYYVDGVPLTGIQQIGSYWYYFEEDGVMATGWKTVEGNRYYFDTSSGKRQHGKEKIGKYTYYFDPSSGVMVTGWLSRSGKRFYHNSKGRRVFGAKKIGKYYYYFKRKSGAMKKGWLRLKKKTYYYNKHGHKVFGVKKIGGKKYYFNLKTGAKMKKGRYFLYRKIWYKSSSTAYLIYVNKRKRKVYVYKGRKEHWNLIKTCRCSIGAPSTPTPSDTYRVSCKVLHFGEGKGYTVWYATGFIGSTYLLHSIVCYRGTKRPSDGRLGMAISHGCVRMPMSMAKWMYEKIPHGTTVFIC